MTSEPQALATEAADDWETGFPAIGDPHHEIREICRDRGWLDLYYNTDCGHLRERDWASHPRGYYQPGVLAIARDGRCLYRWRCVPGRHNMSGAGARPEARYTWERIREYLARADDAPPDPEPPLGAEDLSWPRFLLLLTAHGWFLRPRAFPLARPDDPERVSPGAMMPRVYAFIALWILALVLLPATWVGLAALAWVLVLTPGMIEIHRQFQHVSDPAVPADEVA